MQNVETTTLFRAQMKVKYINLQPFPVRDNNCRLLITFANSLDPYLARQNVRHSGIFLKEILPRKGSTRLAPVHKIFFHQCAISYTCSQYNSDGSVLSLISLKQSHQS